VSAWLRRSACLTTLVALVLAAPARAGESVTYQANAQHTGAVDDSLTPPLGIRWARSMGAESSYPIVAGGKVFVTTKSTGGGYGSTLYALDAASGAVAWSRPLAHTYYWSALAYEAGKLFVLDYDGVLQAFTADSGAALWGKHLGQYSFSSPPVATGGVVYTGGAGSGGTVYAVRESDGAMLWSASVANGDNSSPAVDSAHMYVSYACSQAYSFATASGALAWHHSTGCSGGGGKTPVLYDGRLYIRDSGGPNLILDAGSGSEIGAFGSIVAPAFSNGVGLYMAGSTLAAERTSDRTPLWNFAGDGRLDSAPFVVGSTVYEGSSSGAFYALNRDSGALLWSDCLPAPVAPPDEQNVSQPLTGLGAGNGLLVVPSGAWLVAYESRPGAPSYACSAAGPVPVTGAVAPGTSAAPGQAGALTLSASRAAIRYGQTVTLRGQATPGAKVDLQSDPFPVGKFSLRKSTTAAGDGRFSFRVRPGRNTAFKVVANGSESGGLVVYTDVGGGLVHRVLRNGHTRITTTVVGPPDLPYKGRTGYFYVIATSGKTARRIGTRRLAGKRGRFTATLVTGVRARHYAMCVRELKPDAWGRPAKVDKVCGAPRMRL
jgi:outer membrane protein assembly factor BamB